ncbi:uncharacterized protein LOC125727877 isoform X2 [Brienomyrus brachyistius]|nr:uncharacterized protein LOC125727877 isoform X2 [Brienomyrus brachyistius]
MCKQAYLQTFQHKNQTRKRLWHCVVLCPVGVYVGLALTSLTLIISISLNVIFYWQRYRDRQCTGQKEHIIPYSRENFSSDSIEEDRIQDNPIYGNIHTDRAGGCPAEMLYEHMEASMSRENKLELPPNIDVSYASLDLMGGKKNRKKRRGKQSQAQPKRLVHAHSQQEFLELEMDSGLPPRQSSPMASRNSIYLNSHQMALESREQAWEMRQERQRDMETEADVEAIHDDPARFIKRANQSEAFDS